VVIFEYGNITLVFSCDRDDVQPEERRGINWLGGDGRLFYSLNKLLNSLTSEAKCFDNFSFLV
jgi:hypothetical protein